MGAANKVTAKIYGVDYTIAGAASSKQMSEVADYVDKMMRELGKGAPSTVTTLSLAVLTAVNIASQLYDANDKNAALEQDVEKLQKEQDGIVKLWEDAKKSFIRYKEEASNSVEQLQELQRIFNAKSAELNQMKAQLEEMTARYEQAKAEAEEAGRNAASAASAAAAPADSAAMDSKYRNVMDQLESYREESAYLRKQLDELRRSQRHEDIGLEAMREKYNELENSFFDIQMDNINLKNELDDLRKK